MPTGFRLLALAAVFAAGCAPARPEPRPTHPVSGRVLVNGKAAAGAPVTFLSTGGMTGNPPTGTVRDDGGFRLSTYQAHDGAPEGEYVVTVVWPAPPKPGTDDEGPDRLSGRYATTETFAAKVTVRPGNNDLPPFHLK